MHNNLLSGCPWTHMFMNYIKRSFVYTTSVYTTHMRRD